MREPSLKQLKSRSARLLIATLLQELLVNSLFNQDASVVLGVFFQRHIQPALPLLNWTTNTHQLEDTYHTTRIILRWISLP